MANLASTAVTLYPDSLDALRFPEGRGISSLVSKSCKVVLTGQGGTTNQIPASAFGLTRLTAVSNLLDKTNNKVYLATIDPVVDAIRLALTNADTAADVTSAESYITVTGFPV